MNLAEAVLKIKPVLKEKPYIHAMWLEGSYATGQFHDESDIDVWLDVDKDKFEDVKNEVAEALFQLGILRMLEDINYYSKDPYLAKTKFYLKDKTDAQRIELDMQAHGRDFQFSRTENDVVVLFDKDNVIRWSN